MADETSSTGSEATAGTDLTPVKRAQKKVQAVRDKVKAGEYDSTPAERGEAFVPTVSGELVTQGPPGGRDGDTGISRMVNALITAGKLANVESATRLLDKLSGEEMDDATAAYESHLSIIEQILTCDIEEVLTPPEAIAARDIRAVPLRINGFDFNVSEFEVGAPVYASMRCVRLDTGESMVVNSGTQAIIAQLVRYELAQRFPVEPVYVREAKRPNRHGSLPLRLDARPPDEWR